MKRILFSLASLALLFAGIGLAQAQQQFPLRPLALALDTGTKTATATAGAATLNKASGVITTEALTTVAAATYVLTLTNSAIAATDMVFVSVWFGTSTTGVPTVASVKPGAGNVVITIQNIAAAAVFNGTLKIAFMDLDN